MEARLAAIKKGLLLLLAASLVLGVLARPAPENRLLVQALDELTAFRARFDREAAEQALLRQALSQGEVALQSLDAAFPNKQSPRLKVAEHAPAVRPLGVVSLATLSAVATHAQPNSTLRIGTLDVAPLAPSLTWRLARTKRNGTFVLTSVELVPADVTHEDVAFEQTVAELRLASLDARAALEDATRKVDRLRYRLAKQNRRRSSSRFKTQLAYDDAKLLVAQGTQIRIDTQRRYEAAVHRATRPRERVVLSTLPEAAIARVKLSYGGEESVFEIPVALVPREVQLSPVSASSFAATRAASLWPAVQDGDAAAAIAVVEGRFNWHFHRISVFGTELSGTSVLQLMPCVLPCLLWLLLVLLRRAETSYSPFATKVPDSPPSVGFDNRFIEFIAIFILPLSAVASAASALVIDGRLPIGPALTGFACVALGVYAFTKIQDLREQTVSIVRSQSMPPVAPTV